MLTGRQTWITLEDVRQVIYPYLLGYFLCKTGHCYGVSGSTSYCSATCGLGRLGVLGGGKSLRIPAITSQSDLNNMTMARCHITDKVVPQLSIVSLSCILTFFTGAGCPANFFFSSSILDEAIFSNRGLGCNTEMAVF